MSNALVYFLNNKDGSTITVNTRNGKFNFNSVMCISSSNDFDIEATREFAHWLLSRADEMEGKG